jgi:hypothetical protein
LGSESALGLGIYLYKLRQTSGGVLGKQMRCVVRRVERR